jgi:hypothetical protein
MNEIILNNIPFQPNLTLLMKKLRLKEGSSHATKLKRLANEAQAIAKPRALYKVGFIESKGDDYVVIDGITLTSRVLRVNLEPAYRIFPYVATSGIELDDWARSMDDMLDRYSADMIAEMALRSAIQALKNHLEERYRPGATSVMSPGSLVEWPIEEQRQLFALLGNPKEAIGVQLLDSLLMIPTKSVSGIRFPTTESFESCQLCPREDCPGRRASYDEGLYERKYVSDQ